MVEKDTSDWSNELCAYYKHAAARRVWGETYLSPPVGTLWKYSVQLKARLIPRQVIKNRASESLGMRLG